MGLRAVGNVVLLVNNEVWVRYFLAVGRLFYFEVYGWAEIALFCH